MTEIKIQNKWYTHQKHPNPEKRCNDCDIREWCCANDFMMACAIFNSEAIFKKSTKIKKQD